MKKFLEIGIDIHAAYITAFGVVLSVFFRQPLYLVSWWIIVLCFLLQSALFSDSSVKWQRFFLSVLITGVFAGIGALFSWTLLKVLET